MATPLPSDPKRLRDLSYESAAMGDARWLPHYVEVCASLRAAADRIEAAGRLIRDFTDPDECWFDHHGGCQAHGYLTLQPGELCPHAEAKRDWDVTA